MTEPRDALSTHQLLASLRYGEAMKERIARITKVVSYFAVYLAEYVGMGLIAIGTGMMYRPLGFITAGALIVAVIEVKA